ncbi:hypothetical protein BGZ99_010196 [Dissophora globulifera]|uniref:Uncharacterized protein n=1 Tax=Dissophora globulifera TaxID=979702 RepID=A0A9P6RQB1_9FUNG|nr:hypothetical protein BGZ99_010196 [Dissophora globulifera]
MDMDLACPTTTGIDILDFALTLEHLEAAFYDYGITGCENDHVTTLSSVISSLGGNLVPERTYNFLVENVSQFLVIAQALETTGVSAYTGAIDSLDVHLLTAAGVIATGEGRHSYFLNVILGQVGFPYALDTPLSPR